MRSADASPMERPDLPGAVLDAAETWLRGVDADTPATHRAEIDPQGFRTLLLRLCHGTLRRGLDLVEAVAATAPGAEWAELARALNDSEDPLLGPPPAAGQARPCREALLTTLRALGRAFEATPRSGVDTALALGAAYEALVTVEPQRVEAGWAELKPDGVWVDLRDLVKQPPQQRATWLRRRARLSKTQVVQLSSKLSEAQSWQRARDVLSSTIRREAPSSGPSLVLARNPGRRLAGAHYTPRDLAGAVVDRALAGTLARDDAARLRVCDPSVGSGAFLVCAAAHLAEHVAGARADATQRAAALRAVVESCVFGLDRDAGAVVAARLALTLLCGDHAPDLAKLRAHVVCGDALVGCDPHQWTEKRLDPSRCEPVAPIAVAPAALAEADALVSGGFSTKRSTGGHAPPRGVSGLRPLHWPALFPEAFARVHPGFDAIVGNPPWVAYVGRAAQPLEPGLRAYYETINPGFRGYRTLHSMFVHRAAAMLRPGGRLGLVLPTSVADLDGYAAIRRAHDELCIVDDEVPDFGDGAFDGVFQPCMALVSTRRDTRVSAPARIWRLERRDLDAGETSLLERMIALPTLPPSMFGERGYQTTSADLGRLRNASEPPGPGWVALHQGSDVMEFELRPATLYADPSTLEGRFRQAKEWAAVDVLIRQTARFPIAALSSGRAFRNSLVAGFRTDRVSPEALVCFLNSALVRWLHYARFRDARQGMPQLKIGHLRALPDFPQASGQIWSRLHDLGRGVARGNAGIPPRDRERIDGAVFEGFDLSTRERRVVQDWAARNPPPKPRRVTAKAGAR